MRKVFKFIFISGAVFVLAIAALMLWAYTHEDELKAKALAALQEGLVTKMEVSSIEYSVLKHFPNAALQCKNVVLFDTFDPSDTLIYAQEISFEIGLLSLLSGAVIFDQVRMVNGGVKLRRAANGTDNFHFWKSTDTAQNTTSEVFDIEAIRLENVYILYYDKQSDVFIESYGLTANVTGQFSSAGVRAQGDIETRAATVRTNGETWLNKLPIKGSLATDINTESGVYRFEPFDLDVSGLRMQGNAEFEVDDNGVDCKLSAQVGSLDLETVIKHLPTSVAHFFEPYDVKGKGSGSFELNGRASAGRSPAWKAELELKNTEVKHREEGVKLDDIAGKFSVSGGKKGSEQLIIHHFSGYLDGGKIDIQGQLNDFNALNLQASLNADLRLEKVNEFFDIPTLAAADGRAIVALSFDGLLPIRQDGDSASFDATLFKQARYSGQVDLREVRLQLTAMPKPIEELNGMLYLDSEGAQVQALALRIGSTDLVLEGSITNILPWLLVEEEVLRLDATCKSRNFNLDAFLADKTAETTSDEVYHFALPNYIDIRVAADFDQLNFRAFSAKNIKGQLVLNRNGLRVDPMRFETANGSVNLQMHAAPVENGFLLTVTSTLNQLDIRQVFLQFEEFGQDFITSQNLRGQCQADVLFRASMSSSLVIDVDHMVSSIDLKVSNGELIGLQSMQHISDYMRSNKLISPFVKADLLEEKLRHIKFQTLENRIEIKDRHIYFPLMDVKSSAMDIKTSGTHYFDGRIDYSVGLYLRDILLRGNRSEFGSIEDDGLGHRIFLSMTGTTDDPTFGYDRQAKREMKEQEREAEREMLKTMIKDEFSRFKKRDESTTSGGSSGGSDSPNHSISVGWGDEAPPAEQTPQEPPKKRRWNTPSSDEQEKVAPPPDDDDDF